MPWNRLVIVPNASYGNLFERPGFEIDTRARRYEMSGGGLVAYRLTGKTTVQARYDSTTVDFDEDASFRGDSLSILLDRRMSTGGLEFRHRVTPLTTLGVDVHRQEDRFEYATYRDSDSTRVVGTIDLDPFALIKGSARLGYRNFTPLDANVPGFSGLVGALNLSYVARQSTRLSIQALRDVQYSYEVERPYYVQTGVSGSLTQHLVGPFQAAFRVGHHRLAYRALTVPATVASEEDPDTVRAFGASIGYRLGRNSTISFDADHQQRFSVRESQEYKGFRMGVSVTYAF
jgi:hypothetical protein